MHGRPTQSDYKILKSEAGKLASKVKDITYTWSKNNTDNYGLLGDILGEDEYDELTEEAHTPSPPNPSPTIQPLLTPRSPTSASGRRKSGSSSEPHGSSERVSSGASLITYATRLTSSTTHN